jgi:acetyl-CoA acetyltransferase
LADAGIDKSQLQAAYFTNVSQGHMERQHMIRGEIAPRSMGIGGIPVVNVENACASGSTAFNTAVNYVKVGQGDVALAVGAEKMYSQVRELMSSVFDSGRDVTAREETVARLARMGEGVEVPEGTTSSKPHSVFMDVYAAFSRFHMKRFGTTRAQRLPPSPPTTIRSTIRSRSTATATRWRRCWRRHPTPIR